MSKEVKPTCKSCVHYDEQEVVRHTVSEANKVEHIIRCDYNDSLEVLYSLKPCEEYYKPPRHAGLSIMIVMWSAVACLYFAIRWGR